MKNRIKEFREKRNVSVAELSKAIGSKGYDYSEQDILDLESGKPEGFDMTAMIGAAGFFKVPFYELLYVPIEGFDPQAADFDETLLDSAVCFVLEGWFEFNEEDPDLKQIAVWATKVYKDAAKLNLNFTETREYAHAISDPDFDPNAIGTMEKYLELKD